VGVWERPERARDWVVPRSEVSAAVHAATDRWQVLELACDPPGWHSEIEEWADTYGDTVVAHFQTNRRAEMAQAFSRFFTAFVNEQLTHDGNPRLAAHLANAVTKETVDGAYITKQGRNSRRKIDLAVAAVIAYDRAAQAEGGAILTAEDLASIGW
jgi:phage terminase large subunit-like protein